MNGRNDGLAELLVKLATDTATLIDKARASGAFRAATSGRTVDGEAVVRPAGATTEDAREPADAQVGALQDIIVQQAMRVHTLEAEVTRLTAELSDVRAALATAKKQGSGKKAAAATRKSSAKPGA